LSQINAPVASKSMPLSFAVIPGRAKARARNPFNHLLRCEMDSGRVAPE